jgi:transposase
VDLIFYDTTSLHFEIDEEDRGEGEQDEVRGSESAGGKTYRAPRKRGHSKNGRSDAPQIVVGLAVTREGLPVRHWIFPGNTVDVTTVEQVKADLRGWKLSRCVFVGDAGMVSTENLRTLSLGGGKYIMCMPLHQGGEVAEQVMTRPGRYHEVADNLRVKEVMVGDGERRRRYVVCHNPQEEQRQGQHRQEVLAELEAELAALGELDTTRYSKRVFELLASRRS